MNELQPPIPFEARFYYDPVSLVGIRITGPTDEFTEPYVLITKEQYESFGMASKYFVKDGEVKPIPSKNVRRLNLERAPLNVKRLESGTNIDGLFRTIKDCIIFVDPNGEDFYNIAQPKYD